MKICAAGEMTNHTAWSIARESIGTILGLKFRAWLLDHGWAKGTLVPEAHPPKQSWPSPSRYPSCCVHGSVDGEVVEVKVGEAVICPDGEKRVIMAISSTFVSTQPMRLQGLLHFENSTALAADCRAAR